jgi:5-methylcytosine-specific restriction endonuclease McrA
MRHEFSAKTKANAALRANGHCEDCTRRLSAGDFHYDHIIPDAIGGEPTLENCAVLCTSCHKLKTGRVDAPRIAKTKRNYRKSKGIRKRSSFACSRDGRFKKKINGEVVER